MPALDTSSPHGMKERKTGKGRLRSFEFRNPSFSLLPSLLLSLFLSLWLGELWQLPRCPATQWICSRGSLGLATPTCHHRSASNPKLPINSWAHPHLPEGTMTYPPTPPSVCSIPHSTNPPLPLNPALYSLNMPHEMPHDTMTYRCSEIFVPICVCLSVCQTPELYKRGESQFVCARSGQSVAITAYHSGGNRERHAGWGSRIIILHPNIYLS